MWKRLKTAFLIAIIAGAMTNIVMPSTYCTKTFNQRVKEYFSVFYFIFNVNLQIFRIDFMLRLL